MLNIIKEYRHYLLTVLIVLFPLVVLNAGSKSPADFYWFDRAAVAVSAPLQKLIAWTIDSSWDTLEHYLLVLHARKNNAELSEVNRKLLNEIAGYQEMSKENERLHKLVNLEQKPLGKTVVARVIAQDVSPEFRLVRLDKGSHSGVEPGMAVITTEGIVGRVLRVSAHYSDVLTLLDSSSAVDALIQRNRVRGVIEGSADTRLLLRYVRRTDDIQVGDMVISSGIRGLYPKGHSIGRVTKVQKEEYGITQSVEVEPSVDFSRLEEVIVVEPNRVPIEATLPVDDVTR